MFVITTGWGCFECSKSPAVDIYIYISILKPAHLTWTCSYGTGIHMYFHAHSICAAYILFSSIPFHGNPNITGLWIPMKMGWWSSSNDWVNPLHNLTIAHIPSRNPWISIGSILFWVPMEHIYTISGVFQVYIYMCVCVKLYVSRNAWVLPRRCSVYIYNSQTNDIANYSNSYGKNNKGIRDY